jgi:hypothetical protein
VLFVLKKLHAVLDICLEKHDNQISATLLSLIDHKIKLLMGKRSDLPKGNKRVIADAQKLSVQQLIGIMLHHCVSNLKKCTSEIRNLFFQRAPTNPDLVNSAFALCIKQKWQKLQLLLAPLCCDKEGNDASVVTFGVAKRFAFCYKEVLDAIDLCKRQPGKRIERQVLPVLFCRNCKKFDVKLKLCQFCVRLHVGEFPDLYWVCSRACEDACLAAGHAEEHDKHLMFKLGMGD